ncbi:MAG: hypothetical protein K2I23_06765, partial [Clostridia bacterium]|nr:hypothetical protein [Clostridia bacterium]
TIIGDGHKLIFGKGANLGTLNGKLSGLTIESSGDALFISISEKAAIEDVTLNVNADISTTEGTAFLALTNFGSIDGLTLNASGKINALAKSTQATDELTFGGIVQNNYYKFDVAAQTVYRGVIKNCNVNYSQFSLVGQAGANAAFGAVAGVNNGFLQDCKVAGEIIADTFDLAGICTTNNALLSFNVNEANLSQASADTGWNPITCGIVITNAYAVENCQNKGKISSVSSCPQFEIQEGTDPATAAAGIAYLNRGTTMTPYIVNSSNFGNIECKAQYRNTYAAGVCISSSGGMDSCKNNGDVSVKTANGMDAYVGGIATIVYGNISKSLNRGAITAVGGKEAYIGGIAAQSCVTIANCLSSGDIDATAKKVYAGGILGVSEVVRSGYYIYCGIADYCISQVKMNVNSTDGAPVYAGGITGYVKEMGLENNDSMTYFGGCVTNCYFTGNVASGVSYFGNIVGVCGVNTYENNLYNTSNGVEYYNFDGNYYLGNSSKAFGATVTDDDSFAAVEDKGADIATSEFIQNTEIYKTILKNCGLQ